MSGHLKLYACLCAESADHASWVPDACAGHATPVVAEVPNEKPGPMAAGHNCGERLCSGGIRQLETPTRKRPA